MTTPDPTREALETAARVLANYERTDTGHSNADVLNALDEIAAALRSPPAPSDASLRGALDLLRDMVMHYERAMDRYPIMDEPAAYTLDRARALASSLPGPGAPSGEAMLRKIIVGLTGDMGRAGRFRRFPDHACRECLDEQRLPDERPPHWRGFRCAWHQALDVVREEAEASTGSASPPPAPSAPATVFGMKVQEAPGLPPSVEAMLCDCWKPGEDRSGKPLCVHERIAGQRRDERAAPSAPSAEAVRAAALEEAALVADKMSVANQGVSEGAWSAAKDIAEKIRALGEVARSHERFGREIEAFLGGAPSPAPPPAEPATLPVSPWLAEALAEARESNARLDAALHPPAEPRPEETAPAPFVCGGMDVVWGGGGDEPIGLYVRGRISPAAFFAGIAPALRDFDLDPLLLEGMSVAWVRHEWWSNEADDDAGMVWFRPAKEGEAGAYEVTCCSLEDEEGQLAWPATNDDPPAPAPEGGRLTEAQLTEWEEAARLESGDTVLDFAREAIVALVAEVRAARSAPALSPEVAEMVEELAKATRAIRGINAWKAEDFSASHGGRWSGEVGQFIVAAQTHLPALLRALTGGREP